MPPLLADFIYNRVCELKCEKFLTRPDSISKPKIRYSITTSLNMSIREIL